MTSHTAVPFALPLILAGPIVRRATKRRVYLWLATSRPLNEPAATVVRMTLSGEFLDGKPIDDFVQDFAVITLGRRLFVYLFKLEGKFPTGRVLGYEILEDDGHGLAISIFDADDCREEISLKSFDVPTFVLQAPKDQRLHLLYGSCRKLHGPGMDMMAAAVDTLLRSGRKVDSRPHAILLGGDQIYADDVSDRLIRRIAELGRALIGFEFVPGAGSILPYKLSPGARQSFVENLAAFTSGHAGNHLITFGEYAATYILAWNPHPLLWPRLPDDSPEARGRDGARAARMVLANVPAYMIFDDHEVTDDWFLDIPWKDKVRSTSTGRRIISNGLAAYWAFQGLGNDPEQFESAERTEEFVKAITRLLLSNGRDPGQELGKAYDRALWTDFNDWSYVAPTSPPTIVLNTRTRRASPRPIKATGLPGLDRLLVLDWFRDHIGHRLWNDRENKRLIRLLERATQQGGVQRPLIIVAPTPVFGVSQIEWLQKLPILTEVRPQWTDAESFGVNPTSVVDLITACAAFKPEPLIILSGDVHYGFEMTVRAVIGEQAMPILQLCSSSLKNHPEGALLEALRELNHLMSKSKDATFGREQVPIGYFADGNEIKIEALEEDPARLPENRQPLFRLIHRYEPRVVSMIDPLKTRNNLGELVVERPATTTASAAGWIVRHRFHQPRPGGPGIEQAEFLNWDTANWDHHLTERFAD